MCFDACRDETRHLWTFIEPLWWTDIRRIETPRAQGHGQTEWQGCTVSVYFGAKWLWGSVQIRYQHIKTSLRTPQKRSLVKQKWPFQSDMLFHKEIIFCFSRHRDRTLHMSDSSLFSPFYSKWGKKLQPTLKQHIDFKMPSGLQTSNFQPTLATLQSENHITYPPPRSAISTKQRLDPPCQTAENSHYGSAQLSCCAPETINKAAIHPSKTSPNVSPFSSHLGR